MLTLLLAAVSGRTLVGYRPPPPVQEPTRPSSLLWPVVFLAAVIPFLPTLTAGFVSDDFGLAWDAREARGPLEAMSSRALLAFHRPLTMLLWWVGDRLWQGAPLGYHAVGVSLHGLNSLFVYALGLRLIGRTQAALTAALLFAVHPLHVEAVAWPAANSDLLCTTFGLLSLLLLEAHLSSISGRRSPYLIGGALAAFILALFSKEAALALPGVVVLRIALDPQAEKRRRVWPVGAAYSAALALYVVFRLRGLGGVGGYELPLTVWNTVFPSGPLLMVADFCFPLNRTLFLERADPWLWRAAVGLMAVVVLWWLADLHRLPARRLWLWVGFLFLMAVPTWLFRWQLSPSLQWSRFAYLPTIGLFLLVGDACGSHGLRWRRGSGPLSAIILAAALLTTWYITPWREAGRMASDAVKAGKALLLDLERRAPAKAPPSLFVSGLPEANHGAPVLANCYPQALNLASGRPAALRVVSALPGPGNIHPEVMAASVLRPGEFLVSYSARSGKFSILRQQVVGTGFKPVPQHSPTGRRSPP